MRKALTILAMIVVTYLFQNTLRVIVPAEYAIPNLLLILTCSMGLMRGQRSGMVTGFLAGLLYDLFYGSMFGFTALCLLYVGFMNGFLYKVFFDNDIRIPIAAIGLSDLAYNIAVYVVGVVMHQHIRPGPYLLGTILPEVIASILCTIPLYHLYRLINKSIEAYESEAEQSPWLRR